MSGSPSVAELFQEIRLGRKEALDELMTLVYDQLRVIAARQLSSERTEQTLRPTSLVNEAYLRLVRSEVGFADLAHFYAIAARVMRRIIIDHAKAHRRVKRNGGARVTLEEKLAYTASDAETVLAIHEALVRLAELDSRQAEIVELVYFGGLEQDLAAEVLGISPATLRRDLRTAKAWLYQQLNPKRG